MYTALPRMTPCIVECMLSVGEFIAFMDEGRDARAFLEPVDGSDVSGD